MFWRRKKKEKEENEFHKVELRYPDLETFESWVKIMIRGLKLEEGRFTFVAAYGGVLLFIKGEGLSWIPYKQIQEVMKKVDSGELLKNSVVLGSVVAASVAHVAILPIVVIDRSLSGLYRFYSEEPPQKVKMYLHSLIDKVEIKKIKLKAFSKINQKIPKNQSVGNYALQLSIKLKFFDEVELNSLEKFSDSLKKFLMGSDESKFTVPITPDILLFADAIESDGASVEFVGIDRESIAQIEQEYGIED